jgi:hypothetical protein
MKLFFSVVLTFFAVLAGPAQAQQWCTTKVSNLYIHSSGLAHATLSARGDYVAFCNINTTWKNITPTQCASWLSLVRSGVARKANMIFYYNEATPCTQIPSYENAPAPGYIMLMD